MSKSKVTEQTRRQLCQMFLPELHQAWWAEQLAQLQDQQHAAADPLDVQLLEAKIREHYRLQHDVEVTRKRLNLDCGGGDSPPPDESAGSA